MDIKTRLSMIDVKAAGIRMIMSERGERYDTVSGLLNEDLPWLMTYINMLESELDSLKSPYRSGT